MNGRYSNIQLLYSTMSANNQQQQPQQPQKGASAHPVSFGESSKVFFTQF